MDSCKPSVIFSELFAILASDGFLCCHEIQAVSQKPSMNGIDGFKTHFKEKCHDPIYSMNKFPSIERPSAYVVKQDKGKRRYDEPFSETEEFQTCTRIIPRKEYGDEDVHRGKRSLKPPQPKPDKVIIYQKVSITYTRYTSSTVLHPLYIIYRPTLYTSSTKRLISRQV